jgi:hypothetical protein
LFVHGWGSDRPPIRIAQGPKPAIDKIAALLIISPIWKLPPAVADSLSNQQPQTTGCLASSVKTQPGILLTLARNSAYRKMSRHPQPVAFAKPSAGAVTRPPASSPSSRSARAEPRSDFVRHQPQEPRRSGAAPRSLSIGGASSSTPTAGAGECAHGSR